MQFALNDNWDTYLDSTGNIALTTDPDTILQRVKHRLQTFKGECYLDRSLGMPYFEEVNRKNPDLRKIRALILSVIAGVPGVVAVEAVKVDFNARDRIFYIYFRVTDIDENVIEGSV